MRSVRGDHEPRLEHPTRYYPNYLNCCRIRCLLYRMNPRLANFTHSSYNRYLMIFCWIRYSSQWSHLIDAINGSQYWEYIHNYYKSGKKSSTTYLFSFIGHKRPFAALLERDDCPTLLWVLKWLDALYSALWRVISILQFLSQVLRQP